ncbi:hypothetical protein LIER_29456 [Lithospermum erythrorhizon]|uniref:Uncharacterized protein n=1 Tax=Lithospermum erythrorhizon TaxID=34254 RepID=A0AAV3RQ62_LITER
MADEVLAHLADAQALNFSFLPALRHGMECYFEKAGSAFASAPAADIEVARRLIAWDRDMERRSHHRLHEEREEVSFVFRVVRHSEGEDIAADAFLVG